MRLTKEQAEQLYLSIKSFLGNLEFELFLYGSRVNDQLAGGDIDLLIITSSEGVRAFEKYRLDILVAMKKKKSIGQRRIDIKAAKVEDLQKDPFLIQISSQLLKL